MKILSIIISLLVTSVCFAQRGILRPVRINDSVVYDRLEQKYITAGKWSAWKIVDTPIRAIVVEPGIPSYINHRQTDTLSSSGGTHIVRETEYRTDRNTGIRERRIRVVRHELRNAKAFQRALNGK